MIKNSFPLVLEWAKQITPRVRHLAFSREDQADLAFTPGQFITIHIDVDGKVLRRSYSIATIPGKSELIEIAAGRVEGGIATTLLYGLKPGEKITVTGPFGRLILRDEQPSRYVLVATGTGVTPYRSMMPMLAERLADQQLEVMVLLGVRNRDELLYADEFLSYAQQYPNFHFRAYYSRKLPEQAQDFEHQGYVQTSFADLNLEPSRDIVFLCGNPDMIDDAFTVLKDKGFDAKTVRREKYISSGF